jgi:hypothetical protein
MAEPSGRLNEILLTFEEGMSVYYAGIESQVGRLTRR